MSDEINEAGESEELIFEEPDIHAEIASALNAFNIAESFDPALHGKEYKEKVKELRQMCFDIAYKNIKQLHSEVMPEDGLTI